MTRRKFDYSIKFYRTGTTPELEKYSTQNTANIKKIEYEANIDEEIIDTIDLINAQYDAILGKDMRGFFQGVQ